MRTRFESKRPGRSADLTYGLMNKTLPCSKTPPNNHGMITRLDAQQALAVFFFESMATAKQPRS